MVNGHPVGSFATRGKKGSAQHEEYGRDLVAGRCQREAFHPIVRPGLGDAGTVLRRVPLLRGAYRYAGAAGISGNKGCRRDSDGGGGRGRGGGPVIAILGEYDALPGLSQEAGIAEPRPLPGSGDGHGCGHNLLGSASLLAATAVKDFLAAHGIKGRVRYYGCPAEEGGAAKGFMVRAGAFSDVDVAITWHPSAFFGVYEPASLANTRIDFAFAGRPRTPPPHRISDGALSTRWS